MPGRGQRNIVLGGLQLRLQEVFGQRSRSRVVIHGVVLCRARGWIWSSLCAPSSPGHSEPVNCWDLPCEGHRVQPGVPKALIIHHWPPRMALSLLHRCSTLHCAPAGEICLLSKEINLYTFSSHKLMIPSDQNKMTWAVCYLKLEEAGLGCDKPKAGGALLARLCLPGLEVGDLIYRRTQG